MTIASDIIGRHMPHFESYIRQGESLDDIDEYGFTPLIETAITRQPKIAKALIDLGVDVNKPDVTGRTALHWAVDNNDMVLTKLLLVSGANPNAYSRAGLPALVYPILREQSTLKHLLCQYKAKLDFALDFINTKLLGHRFELKGNVDIVNAEGEFVELDYEGFILEFTVAIVGDALRRFTSSYSTRDWRPFFSTLHDIIDAFAVADDLLRLQHHAMLTDKDRKNLNRWMESPILVLPAASRGHALGFVRIGKWWAKVDRGENSKKEGSVNIYKITKPEALNIYLLEQFLYKKQPREFFHQKINQILGLEPVATMPISSQITGNCSWANIQAIVPVAFWLNQVEEAQSIEVSQDIALELYNYWIEWDKDRALDECMSRFYTASAVRKASLTSQLAAVLFQSCDYSIDAHMERAEKILTVLTIPEYYYILRSYLDIYCVKQLTRRGNNLLKILDDCGVNPNIGVNPVATGLKER